MRPGQSSVVLFTGLFMPEDGGVHVQATGLYTASGQQVRADYGAHFTSDL